MMTQEQERLDVKFKREMALNDWRDHYVTDCDHAKKMGRGFGLMTCSDCAFAQGTQYADGHVSVCYNYPQLVEL